MRLCAAVFLCAFRLEGKVEGIQRHSPMLRDDRPWVRDDEGFGVCEVRVSTVEVHCSPNKLRPLFMWEYTESSLACVAVIRAVNSSTTHDD